MEVRAAQHKPRFFRYIFGANDNLYIASELAKVAGPYTRLEKAVEAIESHFTSRGTATQGSVSVRDPVSDRMRHFVTKGETLSHFSLTVLLLTKFRLFSKASLEYPWGRFQASVL